MPSKFNVAGKVLGRMSLGERLLLACSKHPMNVPSYHGHTEAAAAPADPLAELRGTFPTILQDVAGKRVLDFGCGDGFQAAALAQAGAACVLGVDINEQRLLHARRHAAGLANIRFGTVPDGLFDVVISQDAFEHFPDPLLSLQEMANCLAPQGRILLFFGPLWFAPYGTHMYFFTVLPWVNLLFSERTVFRVRRLYRSDDMTSYEPYLNRMSLARFERIIRASGLVVEALHYRGVAGLDIFGRIPLARELFVNAVACVLRRT